MSFSSQDLFWFCSCDLPTGSGQLASESPKTLSDLPDFQVPGEPDPAAGAHLWRSQALPAGRYSQGVRGVEEEGTEVASLLLTRALVSLSNTPDQVLLLIFDLQSQTTQGF
jgi:hypothetical protein